MSKKKSTKRVQLKRLNWDACFYSDIMNGTGFVITEPAEVALEGTKQKAMYGPQSPLYGTTYEDDQSFIERYRCQCGSFKSRLFEGETCPVCNTKVEFKDSNINMTGWISLGNNRIISPYYFNLLQSAIGKTVFPDIISGKYKITVNGRRLKLNDDDGEEKSSKFSGIGVDEFYNRYEEILTHFMNIKKNKTKTFELLLAQKRCVFISHIPIVSTLLRPQSVTSDTYYFSSVDKIVNTTFNLARFLVNAIDVEKPYILQRLQVKVNEMWNIYFNELNGKDGLIRGELLGGSLKDNWVSRNAFNCWDVSWRQSAANTIRCKVQRLSKGNNE